MVTRSRILKLVSSFRGWLQRWHTKLTCMVLLDALDPSIPQDPGARHLGSLYRGGTVASGPPQSETSRVPIARSSSLVRQLHFSGCGGVRRVGRSGSWPLAIPPR